MKLNKKIEHWKSMKIWNDWSWLKYSLSEELRWWKGIKVFITVHVIFIFNSQNFISYFIYNLLTSFCMKIHRNLALKFCFQSRKQCCNSCNPLQIQKVCKRKRTEKMLNIVVSYLRLPNNFSSSILHQDRVKMSSYLL